MVRACLACVLVASGCGLAFDFEPRPDGGPPGGMDGSIGRACSSDVDCDDRVYCNGEERCSPLGRCRRGVVPSCADAFDCTDDRCREEDRSCAHQPNDGRCPSPSDSCMRGACSTSQGCFLKPDDSVCADAFDCTDDACGTQGECVHLAARPCPMGGVCDPVRGCGGPPPCDSTNPCPPIECHTVHCNAGFCDYVAVDGNPPCRNIDPCVSAQCMSGACTPLDRVDCTDTNDCTDDRCLRGADGTISCPHGPIGDDVPCDDGDDCTGSGSCLGTTCVPGDRRCPPSNACVEQTCLAGGGCASRDLVACGRNQACDPRDGMCHCAGGFQDCDGNGTCECPPSPVGSACSGGGVCTTAVSDATVIGADAGVAVDCIDHVDCDGDGFCECDPLVNFCDGRFAPPQCTVRPLCSICDGGTVCCLCTGGCCSPTDPTCCPCATSGP